MSATARKRGGNGEQVVFPVAADKKRRKDTKKPGMFFSRGLVYLKTIPTEPSDLYEMPASRSCRSALTPATFKPILNSSDTPPEEDESFDIPPPPPSERRPTRRRSSSKPTSSRQRQVSTSPSRDVTSKRQKTATGDGQYTQGDPGPSSLGSMLPPTTTSFVRKTRKSMKGMSGPPPDVEASIDSMIPVPENETPMIRKNKELREAQSRRSSFGNRGQRASSSLGRGEISIPHNTVDYKLFYTHLGSSMPEPIRARHLIAWCAKRAADEETGKKSRTKGKDRTSEGDRLVQDIMEEVIMSLGKGNIDTNVFAPVPSGSQGTLRPHPRNVANRKLYDEAEAVIKRSKAENNSWAKLINHTNTRLHATVNRMRDKKAKDEIPEVSGSGWMEDALKLADTVLAEGEGDLTKMGEFDDVEFKVDTLLNSTHSAVQYSRQSQMFLDGIFSSLTADLRAREQGASETQPNESDVPDSAAVLAQVTKSTARAKGKGKTKESTDPMLMLRALASADAKKQDEEVMAAAARVTPVSSSAVPAVPAPVVTATPRRIGQATPRRAGQDRNGPTPRR